MTDAVESQVLDLWAAGTGATIIGRKFGMSRGWVRRIIAKAKAAGDKRAMARKNLQAWQMAGYVPKSRREGEPRQRHSRRSKYE